MDWSRSKPGMASGGNSPNPTPQPIDATMVHNQRATRWMGQEYADMTKLREISAKHSHTAARAEARAARLLTHVDRLRHSATALREKSARVRSEVPALQSSITELNTQITGAAHNATPGMPPTSDITTLQVRARKLQQKIADRERKATGYDLRAARCTQKGSEIKVKADRLLEIARSHEQESQVYRQRADQLQLAADGRLASAGGSGTPPPAPPQ